LGLAIVKHIVNRHRGSLEIQSEPGQGSVFTLYLPAE
jgi:two-component system phosphate regulon sensor histidine kinase PhoR